MVQENRALWKVIVFGILTCGIYIYYFIYNMAKDVNTMCEGDGQKTSGLVAFILLSWLTLGIYTWIWYYSLGNRLRDNAPRYGLTFKEGGGTILLWQIFGSMLFGLGPWIALHILIKNTNAMARVYNGRKNSVGAGQNTGYAGGIPQRPVMQVPQHSGPTPQNSGQQPQYSGQQPQYSGQQPQYSGQQPQYSGQRPPYQQMSNTSFTQDYGNAATTSLDYNPMLYGGANEPKAILYFVQTGQSVTLDRDEFTVGKSAQNSNYVLDSSAVSRQHAMIYRKNGRFYVSDLNSTNGTFVNDNRISGDVQLQDGDNIRFAGVVSVFNILK